MNIFSSFFFVSELNKLLKLPNTPEESKSTVQHLKNEQLFIDYDNLNVFLVRQLGSTISLSLPHVINTSFRTGTSRYIVKIAKKISYIKRVTKSNRTTTDQ